jgi:hypothetical protein
MQSSCHHHSAKASIFSFGKFPRLCLIIARISSHLHLPFRVSRIRTLGFPFWSPLCCQTRRPDRFVLIMHKETTLHGWLVSRIARDDYINAYGGCLWTIWSSDADLAVSGSRHTAARIFPYLSQPVLLKPMAGDYMYFCRCCRINMSTQHRGTPEAVSLIHGKIYSERCVVAQCEGVMYVVFADVQSTRRDPSHMISCPWIHFPSQPASAISTFGLIFHPLRAAFILVALYAGGPRPWRVSTSFQLV